MKPFSSSESVMHDDRAIETRRFARSIADREQELNLRSLDSPSNPTGVSRWNANVPTERSDYSRLEVQTVWVLIAVLAALSGGALYVLWSRANGGW
jgi:hypothetical protein